MAASLKIKTFTLGPFQTNCYVVAAEDGGAWLVDVGADPRPMLDHVRDHGLRVEKIVLTHAHADHIAGLSQAADAYPDAPILIHSAEKDFLDDTTLNLSAGFGMPVVAPPPTDLLAHDDELTLGGVVFTVRHTPGHSPGGVALVQPEAEVALVGDTLFAGSIGRFDFPTSDGPTLIRSIHEQLLTLPAATRILPGHGPASTIEAERKNNPYLRETDLSR